MRSRPGGDDAGRILAATVEAGRAPGEAQAVDRGAVAHTIRVAAGPGGRAALAWAGTDRVLRIALRPGAGAPFGAPVAVPGSASDSTSPMGLHVDAAGRALVAWAQHDGSGADARYRLRAAAVAPDGRVGAPAWLSPPEQNLFYGGRLAGNERGDVVVTWQQARPPAPGQTPTGAGRPEQVARIGTTAGELGPVVRLSEEGRSPQRHFHAAIAPSGRASVLWEDGETDVAQDTRLLVSHLDAAGAAAPTVVAQDMPVPATPPDLVPPLRDARAAATPRSVRVDRAGHLRLSIRCDSWSLDPCRGTVRLRRGGRPLARAPFTVKAASTGGVRLRLNQRARSRLRDARRLGATAITTTPEPQGATRRRAIVLTRR